MKKFIQILNVVITVCLTIFFVSYFVKAVQIIVPHF